MRTVRQWREWFETGGVIDFEAGTPTAAGEFEALLLDMEELERLVEFWKGEQIAWQRGWEAKCDEKQELRRQVEELANENRGLEAYIAELSERRGHE